MIFDGSLTDARVRRDVLAEMAGENQFHDLALARGEAGQMHGGALPPGPQRVRIVHLIDGALNAGKQLIAADRLLDEIESPAIIASTAIGTSLLPVTMMAGNRSPSSRNRRRSQPRPQSH